MNRAELSGMGGRASARKTRESKARARGARPASKFAGHPIGPIIRRLRGAAGMTHVQLAVRLDCSENLCNRWEECESLPTVENLIRLADLFGVTLDELVGREAPH